MRKQESINPIVRLLPSLTDIAFLMPIVMLFLVLDGAKTLLGDGDTGWHLRTGEWIIANRAVPTVDIFSFTKEGQPWFAWEWGWDVIFGWLHMNWGMEAVVLGSILVLCFTFALLFRLVVRQSGNVLVAMAVTFVAMVASSIHWLARPHLFTLLFVVLFLAILERVREGRTKLLFWLPFITLFWTNLHGGFFVGIVIVGTYGAGEVLAALLARNADDRRSALYRCIPYLLAAAACFLVSFVNPYGYQLHVHIVNYLLDPYHREHISEFMSTSFQPPNARFFEALLALGVVTVVWKIRNREYGHALLIIGWAHLALIAGRNIPIFAIVSAVPICQWLNHTVSTASRWDVPAWLRRQGHAFHELAAEIGAIERINRVHLFSLVLVSGLCLLTYAPAAEGKLRAEYDPARYPKAAVEALQSANLDRGVFTDDEWGDYFVYRLYPRTKVFVDGRSDFYGAEFGKKFLSVLNVQHDWQSTLDHYRIHTVLLPVASPLASTLKESARWQVVYDDGIAIAFRSAALQSGTTSFAESISESNRDREITKVALIDRTITQNNH